MLPGGFSAQSSAIFLRHLDLHATMYSRKNYLLTPRLILYLAQRGETVFDPVLLFDATVAELISNVAELLQVLF